MDNLHLDLETPALVRRKGLLRFLIGMGVFAGGVAIVMIVLPRWGIMLEPHGLVFFAIPGAYGLSGFIEVITGVSFMQFAHRWDELKGWQRGILGTLIALLAIFVVIFCMAFFLS